MQAGRKSTSGGVPTGIYNVTNKYESVVRNRFGSRFFLACRLHLGMLHEVFFRLWAKANRLVRL